MALIKRILVFLLSLVFIILFFSVTTSLYANDIKKFKREEGKKNIPWGSIEFHKNVKTIPSNKKIFIFCKKNNLDHYLNEEVYSISIK